MGNAFFIMMKRAATILLSALLICSMELGMAGVPYVCRPAAEGRASALAPLMQAGAGISATEQMSREYGVAPRAAAAIDELKARNFEIVMPVFNKVDDLAAVLEKLKETGLIELCVFIEDVSIDGTREMLEGFIKSGDIRPGQVIFRKTNGKKVRGINEYLTESQNKDAYIMVMVADSVIAPARGESVAESFLRLIDHCRANDLAAATTPFLINSRFTLNPVVLWQKFQLAVSNNMRAINQMTGQYPFLHGACTVWKTSALLEVYADSNHRMDFRTEDVDSTRIAKKMNLKAEFSRSFFAMRTNPEPLGVYFQQQQRWMGSIFANLTKTQRLTVAVSFIAAMLIPALVMPLLNAHPLIFGAVTFASVGQMLAVMARMDISKSVARNPSAEEENASAGAMFGVCA